MQELVSILQIIGAAQGIFLGLMLFSRKENRPANNILSFFIILFSMPMLSRYFVLKGLVLPAYYMSFIFLPTLCLHGPLIYLYTSALTTGSTAFRRKQCLHFIPAVLVFIAYMLVNIFHDFAAGTDAEMKVLFAGRLRPFLGTVIVPIIFYSVLSGLLYTLVSWNALYRYTRTIKEYFSDILKLRLLWLKIFIGLLLLMFINLNIFNWLGFFNVIRLGDSIVAEVLPLVFGISCIFLTAFFALRQPDIFRYTNEMAQEFSATDEHLEELNAGYPKAKYEKYGIDDIKKESYLNDLLRFMDEKKPYLNDEITLKDLADELRIPAYHLSIVINDRLNQNFYTFINGYRIKEVMAKLADPRNSTMNVLNLAFSSGFNSKSTFNSAFKSIAGMTPTDYRKSKQPDQSPISA